MLSDNDILIAPSTYYDNVSRRPSKRAAADAEVIELIHQARTNKFVAGFGARKMWLHLRGKGHDAARCTVMSHHICSGDSVAGTLVAGTVCWFRT